MTLKPKLIIKKSKLPGAGKGLFTLTEFSKGDRITEYKGRLQRWTDIKHLDGYNGYILRISRTLAINAERYLATFGRYANDAAGLKRIKGQRNNAEYIVYGKRCYIEAVRPIKKGEEILVSYGREYWDLIRKIRQETKKASEA